MNRYIKLVNFEFNRIAKVFFTLVVIVLVSQMLGVIIKCSQYLDRAKHAITVESLTKAEFLQKAGQISMSKIADSLWFQGPVDLCIGFVAFYIFLIWYRDWFGKNTFIYRLLMLPTARVHVFLAKLTTILMITFGFVAIQLILLLIENQIFQSMIPKGLRMNLGLQQTLMQTNLISSVIPNQLDQFILSYTAGITMVSILFTAILFERSFRLKGIFIAVGYCLATIIFFCLPLILQTLLHNYFYNSELFQLMIFTGLIALFGSIGMSRTLLNKRIRV